MTERQSKFFKLLSRELDQMDLVVIYEPRCAYGVETFRVTAQKRSGGRKAVHEVFVPVDEERWPGRVEWMKESIDRQFGGRK